MRNTVSVNTQGWGRMVVCRSCHRAGRTMGPREVQLTRNPSSVSSEILVKNCDHHPTATAAATAATVAGCCGSSLLAF